MEVCPVPFQQDMEELHLLSRPYLRFLLVLDIVATGQRISITDAHSGGLRLVLFLRKRAGTTKSMESIKVARVCFWGYYNGVPEDDYWCYSNIRFIMLTHSHFIKVQFFYILHIFMFHTKNQRKMYYYPGIWFIPPSWLYKLAIIRIFDNA